MNRFLAKKRAKESPTTEQFPSEVHARSLTPSLTRKGRRWRKNQPEPKLELDLSTALPSDDNFRTSLLMNGLSARFSMLREQDDPNSKLGKASDDSVLSPKRHSRLHEFGFVGSGLADIAEVSSVKDSIRPPFAQRQASFASGDGYGTDDESTHGSIMSRSRPGEGNVLFGGRQKVYRIPVASSTTEKASRIRGKAVYEDDISLSAFQKLRQKEKEQLQEESSRASEEVEHTEGDEEKDNSYPASSSGSSYMKRQTSSSTTSQPSITAPSTAATSIASQGANAIPGSMSPKSSHSGPGLERSLTKSRRLYEQGLNEHLHEQQASALTRLNSIQKQRTAIPGRRTPPYLAQNKSTTSLHDRFNRPGNQVYQATSPPPSAPAFKLTTFESLRESKSSAGSSILSYPNSPPLSPPAMSDGEDTPLTMSLNPNDRGKATAMGAFNKPKQQFDEAQYLERQKQMLKGAEQPVSNVIDEESSWSPPSPGRDEEGDSLKLTSSNSSSRPSRAKGRDTPLNLTLDTQRTFFRNIVSDSEDEPLVSPLEISHSPKPVEDPLRLPAPVTPVEQHPAFRSDNTAAQETAHNDGPQYSAIPEEANGSSRNQQSIMKEAGEYSPAEQLDSPTLGADDAALSGLIHQHLRHGSGASSIWGDRTPAPAVPSVDAMPRVPPSRMVSKVGTESSYTHSNPWDLDEIDSAYFGEGDSFGSSSPVEGYRAKNQQFFGSAMPMVHKERSAKSKQGDESWQQILKNKHTRGGSTETQQEREAFASELAQRQKAIQENMKTRAENRSRAPSPSFGSDRRRVFGMLRNKSSRESVVTRAEPSSKALKRLGISGNENSSTSSLMRNQTRRSQASGSDERDDASIRGRRMPVNTQKSVEDMRRKWEAYVERENGRSRNESPRRATTYSQSSHGASMRDRSNSELSSGRSRSRASPYRDDENLGPPTEAPPEISPRIPHRFQLPMDLKQSQAAAMQNPTPPSSAKFLPTIHKGKSGYFDVQSLKPIQTGRYDDRSGPSSESNSPMFPMSASSARLTPSAHPLPHSPPDSASSTPPTSALPTPNAMPAHTPFVRSPMPNRKRSVQKSEISEPVLISSTSNFDTVDLPPGASLKNGREASSSAPPPVPPMNPLRRRTQKLFGNPLGRSDSAPEVPKVRNVTSPPNEMPRTQSSPDDDERSWSRQQTLNPSDNRGARIAKVASPPPSPPDRFKQDTEQVNARAAATQEGMF